MALDSEYSFIQRIPRSHYVLAVGPIPYLFYLHEMRLLDLALLLFIGLSLALPGFSLDAPTLAGFIEIRECGSALG
ncbi:Sensor protein RstB [Hafnia alvei]|uniref:Sensor protein RstB n=1 Tax=Hafnia alvei TaxID=569 RepID=A0A377PK83_HAFAL|nr:Sensor protein RstB [Hafnia alvei]